MTPTQEQAIRQAMRGKGNAHFRKMLAQAMREIDRLRQIIYTHADAMRGEANSWEDGDGK